MLNIYLFLGDLTTQIKIRSIYIESFNLFYPQNHNAYFGFSKRILLSNKSNNFNLIEFIIIFNKENEYSETH